MGGRQKTTLFMTPEKSKEEEKSKESKKAKAKAKK